MVLSQQHWGKKQINQNNLIYRGQEQPVECILVPPRQLTASATGNNWRADPRAGIKPAPTRQEHLTGGCHNNVLFKNLQDRPPPANGPTGQRANGQRATGKRANGQRANGPTAKRETDQYLIRAYTVFLEAVMASSRVSMPVSASRGSIFRNMLPVATASPMAV